LYNIIYIRSLGEIARISSDFFCLFNIDLKVYTYPVSLKNEADARAKKYKKIGRKLEAKLK